VHVGSAGFNALAGLPADPIARRLMAEIGIPIEDHRGRSLEAHFAIESDLILVMDNIQRDICASLIPVTLGRIFLLGHWLETGRREIPDPFRRGEAAMQATLDHILDAVATWLPRLKDE